MGKTPEDLYRERAQRVRDAVALREPDMVPFQPFYHFFPAKYAGITNREVMFDYEKLAMAWKKVTLDFEPDGYNNPFLSIGIGPLMEILDCRQIQWPGGELPVDKPFQFIEKEYMTAEEYDDFLFDPTDYIHRVFLPRAYGALEPLQMLPPTPSLVYFRLMTGTGLLGVPQVAGSIQALLDAAAETQKLLSKMKSFIDEMTSLGFPCQFGAIAFAPFDYFGDLLRGTRGVLMDMYKCPDKLLESMEKMVVYTIRGVLDNVKASGNPYVYIPLHKSIDNFMSSDHFKTFFWPSLKKVILRLIEEGLVPCPFWEGNCESRLETIRDIPSGKAIYMFEQTDIFKAKDILGDTACIRGNVPASLLCTGSPQEVTEYCKKIIEYAGKGGGFILDGGVGGPDESRPENIRAMADAVRKYGVYG
ncbi:uroporphyrinogen decarboxylase family protein [Thermodesulfobacteriota bacterium]